MKSVPLLKFLLFAGLFLITQVYAETNSSSPLDLPPVIRHICINRENVFETGSESDHHFPYSWANKIHIVTRERYIRNEILFREGDPFDPEKILESERILRHRPIFRYVTVRASEPVNGFVDVFIETEDVWTTNVDISYSIAGGKNSYTAGIHEQNFLGLGKEVGAFISHNIDRTTRGVAYRDPQFLGSRWDFFGGYGRDEKGREWESHLERPYFSSTVRHSEGGSIYDREDEDRLFENGEEVANFDHHTQELRVFSSYALVASQKKIRRISIAYERSVDEFANVRGPQAPLLPQNRYVTPFLFGLDFQRITFHKIRGVTTFDRDEDINLGGTLLLEGGPSMERWGATRDGWVGRAMVGKNFHFYENQMWFNAIQADTRLEQGIIQDGIIRFRSHYFLLDWLPKNTASLRGEYVISKNLDPEKEFLLGGENGLRGYSVRQFSGPNRALFTLENRRAVLYDWLHLVNIGWAVFTDAGAVWEEHHQTPPMDQFHSDVGAGLRLAPSRSVDPGLIRIDVAYALEDNNRSSRFVLSIGADISFGEKRVRKFDQ